MKVGFKLNNIEIISIAYALLTGIFTIIMGVKDNHALTMISCRLLFISLICGLAYINTYKKNNIIWFIRNVFPLTLISYWYPETYYINENIFSNMDPLLIAMDQALFNCQPSLVFSANFPEAWINELMNFGYISYYFIIAGAVFLALLISKKRMEYTVFIILCSFFLYYITFIIIPVVGPQFYFSPPDNILESKGIFREILLLLQDFGELPTGAFPSSHVGLCLICMYLILKDNTKAFYILLPIAIILICSTVYIKAHYLTDVIGGFISAPIFYWISRKAYLALNKTKKISD